MEKCGNEKMAVPKEDLLTTSLCLSLLASIWGDANLTNPNLSDLNRTGSSTRRLTRCLGARGKASNNELTYNHTLTKLQEVRVK